jgi:hypothetical protein
MSNLLITIKNGYTKKPKKFLKISRIKIKDEFVDPDDSKDFNLQSGSKIEITAIEPNLNQKLQKAINKAKKENTELEAKNKNELEKALENAKIKKSRIIFLPTSDSLTVSLQNIVIKVQNGQIVENKWIITNPKTKSITTGKVQVVVGDDQQP